MLVQGLDVYLSTSISLPSRPWSCKQHVSLAGRLYAGPGGLLDEPASCPRSLPPARLQYLPGVVKAATIPVVLALLIDPRFLQSASASHLHPFPPAFLSVCIRLHHLDELTLGIWLQRWGFSSRPHLPLSLYLYLSTI